MIPVDFKQTKCGLQGKKGGYNPLSFLMLFPLPRRLTSGFSNNSFSRKEKKR